MTRVHIHPSTQFKFAKQIAPSNFSRWRQWVVLCFSRFFWKVHTSPVKACCLQFGIFHFAFCSRR